MRNLVFGFHVEGFLQHGFFSSCLADQPHVGAEQISSEIPHNRATGLFRLDRFGNGGCCLLEEIYGNGGVSEKSFGVRDGFRCNPVSNGQNSGKDFSAREVNRVEQESGTGFRFSHSGPLALPILPSRTLLTFGCYQKGDGCR